MHEYRVFRPDAQASSLFVSSASGCFRHLDRNSEFAGGGRQAPIECEEGRIEAMSDRQMQGIWRS